MDHVNYFKDLFDSIPDYRKIVLLIFLIQNDDDLSKECGFFKSDSNRDVEFAGSSTFSWKLDPGDRLLDPALDPAFSEKNNKYVENEFNQCQHYTAM